MNNENKNLQAEDAFRSSLQDVLAITQKLSSFCSSVEELADMVALALENQGQLKMLMALVMQKK